MDEQDVILGEMEETRSALSAKLETLEQEVADKVLTTTENVESVVNAVQETVETVKESVQETVTAVTDSVKDSVSAVKNFLDVPAQVGEHPWVMFTGSVALGFCAGKYLSGQRRPPRPTEAAHTNRPVGSENGKRHARSEQTAPPQGPGLLTEFAPEIKKLKGIALGALMGLVREMVLDAVPSSYHESLNEVITSVTEKIGGLPVAPAEPAPAEPEAAGFAMNRM